MSNALDMLLVFMVLTDLILLGSSRLRNAIRIVALQGLMLGLLPLLAHGHGFGWSAVLLGAGSALLKGFVFPALLTRALRETNARREIEPLVGYVPSLLIGMGVLALSFGFGARLPLPFFQTMASFSGSEAKSIAVSLSMRSCVRSLRVAVSMIEPWIR